MDSGWAIVIGAGIALFGSAIVPWVKETIQTERREEAERRVAQGSAIAALADEIAALTDRVVNEKLAVRQKSRAFIAAHKVGLLLRPADAPIERMAETAIDAIGGSKMSSLGPYLRLMSAWHRGEITAAAAQREYQEQLDAKNPLGTVTSTPDD
jgi:hypothetical protein